MFPAYILEKLFVTGSLQNCPNGFRMRLRNIIDSGTITGLGALTLNEKSYPPEKIFVIGQGQRIRADQISNSNPLPVHILSEIELEIESEPLPPGECQIGFVIATREAGRLQFTVKETLSSSTK